MEITSKSSSVRRKSRTLAWQRFTSSTKKVATIHLRWCSLSATAVAAVMAAEAAVMVVGVTVAAAEVAITDAGATAAEVAVVAAASV